MDKSTIRNKCRLAIKNIIKEGTTDVDLFARPFELKFLENETVKNDIVNFVTDAIASKKFEELKLHKIGHVLVPKKNLCDFRKCALIDIIDEIVYLTLVLCIANNIEKARIIKSKNRIFSYRYKVNDDYLFDKDYHFTSFRKIVETKSKNTRNKVVVECDISNFYDRVNIHRIESSLLSLEDIDSGIVQLINQTLLFWANRDSYGLPVGSNASRLLAEASLLSVDQALLSHKVDFCRFVDDYRIFAKDAQTAHSHLSLLVKLLNKEGLFINIQKTRIKDISSMKRTGQLTILPEEILEQIESASINTNNTSSSNNPELPKIIRGYNGLVPTKFRKLTEKESTALRDFPISSNLESISKSVLVEPPELIKVLKAIVAQEKFESLDTYIPELQKYPQLIPYYIDCIYKYSEDLPTDQLENIKLKFKSWYEEDDNPEYLLIYLIKLFNVGKTVENDKEILLNAFRNLKRVSGDYIGRALLESFNGKLSRTEVLEIRDYYTRADIWEKRQILRLVQNQLPKGEKQAFFKNVLLHDTDILTKYIASGKNEFVSLSKYKK